MFFIVFKSCKIKSESTMMILALDVESSALHVGVNMSGNLDKTISVSIERRIIPPMTVKTICAINIWLILFMRLFSMFSGLYFFIILTIWNCAALFYAIIFYITGELYLIRTEKLPIFMSRCLPYQIFESSCPYVWPYFIYKY